MKMIVALAFALVAVVVAAPVQEEPVKTLRSNFDQTPEGGYNFGFETSNGIIRTEEGELKSVNDEDNKPQQVVVTRGSYEYPGEDGKTIRIAFVADEHGYRAEGDSIPVGPASR